MTIKVTIKWGKQTYKDVEIDQAEPVETLQAQLFSMTGVPVERQKLLSKGKKIATDADLQKLKDNQKLMMMGTADALPTGPKKPVIFEEDLTEDQKVTLSGALGGGLHNLGNTCYMNSTLQCFRGVPELTESLHKYSQSARMTSGDLGAAMTASMGRLFQSQNASASPVTPAGFTQYFRALYPQFAEQSPQGGFMQQDADECLGSLLTSLSNQVKTPDDPSGNMVDFLFSGEMTDTVKCLEGGDDPAKVTTSSFRKLRVNIDSSTNHMAHGIKESLKTQLEFRSPSLGRNAMHSQTSEISKLPRYLNVQFVRFFWRKDTQKKAKILRKVQFPTKFDILEFCDPKLRKTLSDARHVLIADSDKKLGLTAPAKAKEAKEAKEDGSEAMDTTESAPSDVPDTLTSGNYELYGVVTHKGRSADSGHYVGWVKAEKKPEVEETKEEAAAEGPAKKKKKIKPEDEEWIKYDDDVVTSVTAQEVMNLSGGGDWHMSYILFYKRVDDMLARSEALAKR